jgi:hypothetical protein
VKHSVDELLQIIDQHYWRSASYDGSEPYGARDCLVEVRKEAGKPNTPWSELLARLYKRFPDRVTNRSLHLTGGGFDACYSLTVEQAPHEIGLAICFIAPYYVVYSSRNVDRTYRESEPKKLQAFVLDDDEKADAQVMIDEMNLLFPAHEPMPPDIGNIVVPDVMAGNQELGKATLYHCFFTDSW